MTYIFLVAPVVVVILVSFNPEESLTINLAQPSLRWYTSFFQNANFLTSFTASLEIAALTAVAATLLGVPAAYGLARSSFRGRGALQMLFLSPLMVPAIVLGVALLNLYFTVRINGSITGIVLAHIAITAPYIVRTATASLAGLDLGLEEAATGLGASELRTFFTITLPLMRSGVIAGAILVFILSFGELNATVFLTAPGATTLPVQIFSELIYTTNPMVAAASVTQILIITAGVLAIEKTVGISRVARF
jgi:putative spermidine/putrescine transport system permease protein